MKLNSHQSDVLLNTIIDLTQSSDVETSRRARSALFEAKIIKGNDGGVSECKELYDKKRYRLIDR